MMKRSRQFGNKRGSSKREKIIMIASSALVLTALTMTGVYVKNSSDQVKDDGYHIDFDALERQMENYSVPEKADEIGGRIDRTALQDVKDSDFLPETPADVPGTEQVDSGNIEIPGLTDSVQEKENLFFDEDFFFEDETGMETADIPEETRLRRMEEDAKDQAAIDADAGITGIRMNTQPTPDFSAGDRLVWPVTGNVLIPYSMDKTVYFATLKQYRYNPGLVISATVGDAISTAAAGKVTDIYTDPKIGKAVKMDIGGGYEIIYGQLEDITVSEGAYMERGTILGYVGEPTIYYCVEGANVYFELDLGGVPVDPMGELQ